MSVEIKTVKFLDYDIRSCIVDDTEMFLVSDLIRQYNKINKTNKQFYHYLENKQTKELLENWNKNKGMTVPRNSDERSECSEIDKFNRKINVGENIHQRSTSNKIDIKNFNMSLFSI